MNSISVLLVTSVFVATASVRDTDASDIPLVPVVHSASAAQLVAKTPPVVPAEAVDASTHVSKDVVAPAPAPAQLGSVASVESYCDATPNTFGTIALIGHMGSLDLAQKTFGLRVLGAPPVATSFGMFTCGVTQTNVPFGNGYLCISPFAPGIFRMRMQSLGAGPISKTMVESEDEFSMCTPGSAWNFQFWYRNPAAGAITFNTSDAMHVQFAP